MWPMPWEVLSKIIDFLIINCAKITVFLGPVIVHNFLVILAWVGSILFLIWFCTGLFFLLTSKDVDGSPY